MFAPFRGRGYATRAVRLLLRHLAEDTEWRVATLLIHPDNDRSLAVAGRAGFERVGELDGNPYWKQPVAAALEATRFWAQADAAAAWYRDLPDDDRARLAAREAEVDRAFDGTA